MQGSNLVEDLSDEESNDEVLQLSDTKPRSKNVMYYPSQRRSSRVTYMPDRHSANIVFSNHSEKMKDLISFLEALKSFALAEWLSAINEELSLKREIET